MQEKYVHPIDGAEVSGEDLNLIGRAGAHAEDRVIAELFRLRPFSALNDPSSVRGILPWGLARFATLQANTGVVMPGSSGFVRVYPFRAVIGTRNDLVDGREEHFYDVRSAVHAGQGATEYTPVQIPSSTEGRFDLVYCTVKLDVPGPVVERAIKDTQGQVNPLELSHSKVNTVTIGRVEGEEPDGSGEDPLRPDLPEEGENEYHIPLAYVRVPAAYSGGTIGPRGWVHEVAPVLDLAPQVGGFSWRTASIHQVLPTGQEQDLAGAAFTNPNSYLPASWVGGVQVFLCIDTREIGLGVPTVVDNSMDWTRRIGKVTIQSGPYPEVAWNLQSDSSQSGTNFTPSGRGGGAFGQNSFTKMFNTFVVQTDEDGEVLYLDTDTGLTETGGEAVDEIEFRVDAFGRLVAVPNASMGAQAIMLWFEMSAQLAAFPNQTPPV